MLDKRLIAAIGMDRSFSQEDLARVEVLTIVAYRSGLVTADVSLRSPSGVELRRIIREPKKGGSKMDCPKCGRAADEDYTYCPGCGARLEDATPETEGKPSDPQSAGEERRKAVEDAARRGFAGT